MRRLLGTAVTEPWSSYVASRPVVSRTGKLPGQRAEDPLSSEYLRLWLDDLQRRNVSLLWHDGKFAVFWPTLESYGVRDVERLRVNWSALLRHFGIRREEIPLELIPRDTPLDQLPLLFLDTETTGSGEEDRIIELGVQSLDGSFSWLARFDPGMPSSPGALAVHGIPDDQLVGEPEFGDRADEVLELLSGQVLVAHNVGFDRRMLKQEFARCGIDWEPIDCIDTVRLSRRLYPELTSHKLTFLAEHFGIDHRAAHTAAGDTITLRALWAKLLERLPSTTTLQDLL